MKYNIISSCGGWLQLITNQPAGEYRENADVSKTRVAQPDYDLTLLMIFHAII